MKQLLFAELKRLVPAFTFTYLVSCFYTFYWDIPVFLVMIPACSVAISNLVLRRSSWYLSLPWSRAKIIRAVLLQNLVIFLVNFAIVALLFVVEGKLFFGENGPFHRWIAIIGYVGIWIFSCYRSLAGIQTRKNVVGFQVAEKWAWIKAGLFVVVIVLAWKIDLFLEPVFYVGLMLFLFFSLCSSVYKEFVLPRTTAQAAKRMTLISCCILFSFLIGSAIIISNWDVTRNSFKTQAVSFLGRFPSFVSERRALDLFVKTDIGPSATMSRHLDFIRENVDAEEWKERTLKCGVSDCLNLSSDVISSSALSAHDLEDSFQTLMSFCEFQLSERGQNNCIKRLRMDAQHMRKWLSRLEKDGILKTWLSSGDSKKQIIALKGMSFVIDADQEKEIKVLEQSKDPRLQMAATLFLQNSQKAKDANLDCDSKKDQSHSVCAFKMKEYAM